MGRVLLSLARRYHKGSRYTLARLLVLEYNSVKKGFLIA